MVILLFESGGNSLMPAQLDVNDYLAFFTRTRYVVFKDIHHHHRTLPLPKPDPLPKPATQTPCSTMLASPGRRP